MNLTRDDPWLCPTAKRHLIFCIFWSAIRSPGTGFRGEFRTLSSTYDVPVLWTIEQLFSSSWTTSPWTIIFLFFNYFLPILRKKCPRTTLHDYFNLNFAVKTVKSLLLTGRKVLLSTFAEKLLYWCLI